jgi:membrane associated rhomboid family serine protease
MTPAPVGYQCPICTGRAREGTFGAASYRTRSTVSKQADRVPLVRVVRRAGVTQMLLAANVVVFLLMLLTGHAERGDVLLRFGAMPSPLPRDQWWRLFSAMFVHIGALHLLFNMWALTLFGPAVEGRHGRVRFLALYVTAGFMGNALSLALTHAPSLSAGASGAVFGILGAWIAFFLRHRTARGARQQLQSLFFLVGINLFIGFSGFGGRINNVAHLGGLAGGFIVATALEQSGRVRGTARGVVALAGYTLVVVAGLVAIAASNKLV